MVLGQEDSLASLAGFRVSQVLVQPEPADLVLVLALEAVLERVPAPVLAVLQAQVGSDLLQASSREPVVVVPQELQGDLAHSSPSVVLVVLEPEVALVPVLALALVPALEGVVPVQASLVVLVVSLVSLGLRVPAVLEELAVFLEASREYSASGLEVHLLQGLALQASQVLVCFLVVLALRLLPVWGQVSLELE